VGVNVTVRVAEEEVVFVQEGVTVADGAARVWVYVGGSAVWVGNGVWVADGVFCEEVGEEVCEAITGVEMRLEPDWVRIGVGVGRNIPGTTSSRSPP
jgi:hypothetical protein